MNKTLILPTFLLSLLATSGCSTLNDIDFAVLNPLSDHYAADQTEKALDDSEVESELAAKRRLEDGENSLGQGSLRDDSRFNEVPIVEKGDLEREDISDRSEKTDNLRLSKKLQNSTQTESTQESKSDLASSVELIWQVPGEPVEVYHIYFGNNPSGLDRQVSVEVSELEKYDHPSFGPVFRYYLTSAPTQTAVWVSIQAENKFGKSGRSQPKRIGYKVDSAATEEDLDASGS